ncbi:hypothetical protein [Klebsiella michiganensis]
MLKSVWIKSSFLFIALAFILFGVYTTFSLDSTRGTIIIITGFGLIILTQFDWGEIKVLGLEAKLRNTINDAETVLESLRNISIPISEVSISLAARTGRWGTATPNKELYTLVSSISKELKKIGVTEHDINKIKKDWFHYTMFDMCNILVSEISQKLYAHRTESQRKYDEWVGGETISDLIKQNEMFEDLRKVDLEIENLHSILKETNHQKIYHSIQNLVDRSVSLTQEEKTLFWINNQELWEDIGYFLENKELRRPEFWLNRSE